MKLATKLSLFVGALLLLVCVMIYFLPVYVAERQGEVDRKAYEARLMVQQEEDWNNRFGWLVGEFSFVEGTIDAFLFLTAHNPELFQFHQHKGAGIWLPLAQLLGYSNMINFLQASEEGKVIAGITFANVPHYWALENPINEELSWVTLSSRDWADPDNWNHPLILPKDLLQRELLGVRLPISETIGSQAVVMEEGESPLYLLYDPEFLFDNPGYYANLLKKNQEKIDALSFPEIEDAGKIFTYLLDQLVAAQAYLQKTFKSKAELQDFLKTQKEKAKSVETASPLEGEVAGVRVGGGEAPKTAERRFLIEFLTRKMRAGELEMTTAMALFASLGVIWETPLAPGFAVGAARIEGAKGQGGGIFASDVFTQNRLFDELALYKTHPPFETDIPISTGYGVIAGPTTRQATVVNTLKLQGQGPVVEIFGTDGFLTLGVGIQPILLELRTITGEPIILISRGKVVGYALSGSSEEEEQFLEKVESEIRSFTGKMGFVTLGGERYYYSRFIPREEWDLAFLTLVPAESVEEPYQIFKQRSNILMHSISWYILIVAIVIFVLALGVLIAIAKHFTHPIRTLADATKQVAEGKYDAVVLPKIKESRNEISVLTHAFSRMVQGLSDKAKTRSVLDKVVSKEIADEILKGKVHLGGEVKTVTVFFADIRGFTELSEHLSPEETITFINAYMTEMTRILEQHQGVIDKYVGDEVMALFGAPVPHKYSPLQAIISAILIVERLKAWNEGRRQDGKIVANVGIGINCGEMVAGNMGAEDRLNYTVLGINVTLASRLCEEAKSMEILIPSVVAKLPQVAEHIQVESCKAIQLEGFSGPVEVCRVTGLRSGHTLEAISKMVASYEARH